MSERDVWGMWKRHKTKEAFRIDLQGKHKWGMERMTSMSGTNHIQFQRIIFSADRRCLRQLQSSYVVYNNGLYTTWLFLFNLFVVSLGGQALTLSFIVYLNAF